jgi:hypothetical protein
MILALQFLVIEVKQSSPRIGIAVEEFITKFEAATSIEKFTGPVGGNASFGEIVKSFEDSVKYQNLLGLGKSGIDLAYQLTRLNMEEQGKFLGMYVMNTLRAVSPERTTPQ